MKEFFLQDQARITPDNDWVVSVAFLILVLYVLSRLLFPRYHSRISYAFFNRYETAKLLEERNALFQRAGLMLNFVPVLCIALVVYVQVGWFREVNLYEKPFLRYLAILGMVAAYFGFRLMVVYGFGFFLNRTDIALKFNQLYLFHFQNLSSYILIPALGIPFITGDVKIIVLIIIWLGIAAWWVFTVIREFQILKNSRISLFYLILYFCTLEILPLWWAIKSITEGWR
jgi:hypothetical protein